MSTITLEDYKKSNKLRRVKLLAKYGFKDEASFLKSVGKEPIKIVVKKKPVAKKAVAVNAPIVDYVIAFDTTGSMSSYIGNVKKHVEQLIPNLFKDNPNLQVSIVAFGDYCDMRSAATFGQAYQVCPLTNNENALIKFVQDAKNTSGGDSDEFYEVVINKINLETKWRTGSQKNVLLIADADPHPVGYSYTGKVTNAQFDWRNEAKVAANLGIKYDTLKINKYKTWYGELSKITGGVSLDFKNSNNTANVTRAINNARYNKKEFNLMYSTTMDSGDSELIGAYKTMSTL